MSKFAITVCAVFALAGIRSASAGVLLNSSDFKSYRSTATGGLTANPLGSSKGWDGDGDLGFRISWDIIHVDGESFPWKYSYTISGADGGDLSKGLSHWILQITDETLLTAFDNFLVDPSDDSPTTFTAASDSSSNPGLPADIYGLKFEGAGFGESPVTISFDSVRAPVWGNFYAKDGKAGDVEEWVYIYNSGFELTPTDAMTDFTDWIATPNGSTGSEDPPGGQVPEPASLALWAVLGIVCFGSRWRRHLV